MAQKTPREDKILTWPYQPREQMPYCLKPSASDLKPPWRPVCPKSKDFEPKFRLLCADLFGYHRTMRECRQEMTWAQDPRFHHPAEKEPLQCDCFYHWNQLSHRSRPSSAPAPVRPKKRPAWRPGAAKPGPFSDPGLLCELGPAFIKPEESLREKRTCKKCGLLAKPSPLLRNLMMRIENLMSEYPFGWCATNPTARQHADWYKFSPRKSRKQ